MKKKKSTSFIGRLFFQDTDILKTESLFIRLDSESINKKLLPKFRESSGKVSVPAPDTDTGSGSGSESGKVNQFYILGYLRAEF